MSSWWRLTTKANDVESLTLLALENGAGGCHVVSDDLAIVYVQGANEAAQNVRTFLLQHGASEVAIESEPEVNWVARCNEIWQPVTIGHIRVTPVVDPDAPTIANPTTDDVLEIRLVPNTAFGTGHHESTQQIIELLQDERLAVVSPKSILDVGTGTGVLAFAAALLFPKASVSALDVDPRSVARALENRELNPRCKHVSLLDGTFDDRFGQVELITANIYAEILCDYEPLFYSHLSNHGHLILAGVLDDLAEELESTFARRFLTLKSSHVGEWMGYLMQRK